VAQALGDGIFALFGAPIAHEDHPQRALYAALRMQDEMHRYADALRERGHAPLLMRVGVNTGEVVVRSIRKEDLHTDYMPVGQSTNIAARMEQLAAPGSILVTDQTHKLTAGYFEFKALGKIQVKGVDMRLNVYEVLGTGALRTRWQVAARRGLARFVGRQPELEQLQRALEQARAGHGQIVGVMGEPGVGKSRLFHEGKHLSARDVLVLDTLPYIFALLGIAEPTSSITQMDAQIRKRRTLEAIKRLLIRESLNQPLVVSFEDLHWLDAETQAFLTLLSDSVATANVLLLVNYRPEYRHDWGNKTCFSQSRLDPLGQEDAQELLTALVGDDATLQPLRRLILEKTDGNPFFAVMSLTRLWQQQGKAAEARQMLTDIYNWFTEGFETADLQEAKALLEELTRT
jgi:hypothetical protein